MDKVFYNKSSADSLGWTPEWFNVEYFDDNLVKAIKAWQKENGITPGTYTVKSGDSLSVIAQRFDLTTIALKSLNNLSSNTIQIGQVLNLPGASPIRISEHTIRGGETLSGIADRYSISLARLRAANNLSNDRILVGQVLKIPTI